MLSYIFTLINYSDLPTILAERDVVKIIEEATCLYAQIGKQGHRPTLLVILAIDPEFVNQSEKESRFLVGLWSGHHSSHPDAFLLRLLPAETPLLGEFVADVAPLAPATGTAAFDMCPALLTGAFGCQA